VTATDWPSTSAAAESGARARRYTGELCTDAQVEAFMAAVGAVRAGTEFSVNLIRRQLDDAMVPAAARAALFDLAVGAGLLDRVWVTAPGRRLAVVEPSTGRSAKGARVRVYRRTPAPYRPAAA
jgi:hypothetical protein